MKTKYKKPEIKEGSNNFVFAALYKMVEEYKRTGKINGRVVPKDAPVDCRQCSACHGCR